MAFFTSGGSNNIGSGQITDGAITNDDINAAAGIEATKLANIDFRVLSDVELTGDAVTLPSGTIENLPLLKVQIYVPSTAASAFLGIQFNGDTGNNYVYQISSNGGAGGGSAGQTSILIDGAANTSQRIFELIIANIASREKVLRSLSGRRQYIDSAAGAWVNTSDAITSITLMNTTMPAGTRMIILGKS